MYNNIGNKIKILAKVLFILGVLSFVITALYLFIVGKLFIVICLGIAIVGSLLSWISTWVLYGFGEVIVKLSDIEKNTHSNRFQKAEQHTAPKIICDGCGKSISKYPCVICGYNPDDNTQELAQNYDKID